MARLERKNTSDFLELQEQPGVSVVVGGPVTLEVIEKPGKPPKLILVNQQGDSYLPVSNGTLVVEARPEGLSYFTVTPDESSV